MAFGRTASQPLRSGATVATGTAVPTPNRRGLQRDDDDAGRLRLRLARDRLGLRWQRLGAAPRREGLRGRCARVRAALRRRRVPEEHGRRQALLLEPAPRDEGDLPPDELQGRRGRLRLRRRRRQPRLRVHAVRAAEAVLRGPPVGGDRRLGERARAALRRGAANARRRREPARGSRRPAAARAWRGARRRRHLQTHARRDVLRRERQDRARPVLRRRRSRPHGLQAVRALHGRLRARREEHARQELPLPRREARRARDARTHGNRHPPDRRGRRLGRLRGRIGSLGRVAAQGKACAARARRRRRGRSARHEPAAAEMPPRRLAAARLLAHRRARAHQLGVDPDGDRPRGLPREPDRARRDHLLDLPRPTHAHRDGHVRRRRRLDAPALHAADRRRHARDAAAEAARADCCATPTGSRRCCSPSTGRGARSSSS